MYIFIILIERLIHGSNFPESKPSGECFVSFEHGMCNVLVSRCRIFSCPLVPAHFKPRTRSGERKYYYFHGWFLIASHLFSFACWQSKCVLRARAQACCGVRGLFKGCQDSSATKNPLRKGENDPRKGIGYGRARILSYSTLPTISFRTSLVTQVFLPNWL